MKRGGLIRMKIVGRAPLTLRARFGRRWFIFQWWIMGDWRAAVVQNLEHFQSQYMELPWELFGNDEYPKFDRAALKRATEIYRQAREDLQERMRRIS